MAFYVSGSTLISLPLDLHRHIISFLPIGDIASLTQTCSFYYRMMQDAYIWRSLWHRDITNTELPLEQYRIRYLEVWKCVKCMPAEDVLNYSAMQGYIGLIGYAISRGADNFDAALSYAAERGHQEIVYLMIKLGATNYSWAMRFAASNGHEAIVRLMLEKGATNYNMVMDTAAARGYENIVDLMIERGASVYNAAMIGGAHNGHLNIVRNMIQRGATAYQHSFSIAIMEGHDDIAELLEAYVQ